MKTIVLLLLLAFLFCKGKAQSSLVFYHQLDQANASVFNPAFIKFQKKNILSISPLGGISQENNDPVLSKDLFQTLFSPPLEDSTYQKEIFNKLIRKGLYEQRIEYSLLNLNLNLKPFPLNLRIRDVEQFSANLSGELSNFISNPNPNNLSGIQQQSFPAFGIHYREYSVGSAWQLLKGKLSLGIRVKLYEGKACANSKVQGNVTLASNQVSMALSGMLQVAAPVNTSKENGKLVNVEAWENLSATDYLLNKGNTGMGLDLGFSYQLTPAVTLSASVTDLGQISWRNNLNSLQFTGKTVEFDPNNTSAVENSIYELPDVTDDKQTFTSPVPSSYFVGLSYQLSPRTQFGLTGRMIKTESLNTQNLIITTHQRIGKHSGITLGLAESPNSTPAVPMSILFSGIQSQFYLGSDNLLAIFSPNNSSLSAFSFGCCIFLFTHKHKYQKGNAHVPFYKQKKDKHQTSEGLIFNGYPERAN